MNKGCRPLAVLLAFAPSVHAARPMVTDDARIVDAQSCQVESWIRTNRGSREYWALPGCNFTGNLELTLGGARTSDAEGLRTSDIQLQGKTLFRAMDTDGWGIGLAVGALRHPGDGRKVGEWYSYVPVSFSLNHDKAFVHANVGMIRNNNTSSTRATWGVGTEIQLGERSWLVAESFKQNEGQPFFQAGVRYWIVPNRVQVDATVGNRMGSSSRERWFSIGLRLLSPAFLP